MEGEITPESIEMEKNLRLPQDIIEEILSRLPVKPLLKFRTVSKSWRSLIDSNRFIKTHLQKSTKNASHSHHKIIANPERDDATLLVACWPSVLNDQFAFDVAVDVETEVNIVGCYNGLVCLLENMSRFILWNPSTRMAVNLPDAAFGGLEMSITINGFGYDESSDDYKVFGIILYSKVSIHITRVYSLKNNSWKTLKEEKDSVYDFYGEGIFANGNLHWVMDDREIVSFDLKSEVYGMVELPSYSNGDLEPTLGVIGGCLSVIVDNDRREIYFDIWVMKEYGVKESWVRMATLPNFLDNSISETIVSFCRGPNGEILVIHASNFVIYYPEANVVRHPRIINIDSVMEAGFYVESLISVASHAEPVV